LIQIAQDIYELFGFYIFLNNYSVFYGFYLGDPLPCMAFSLIQPIHLSSDQAMQESAFAAVFRCATDWLFPKIFGRAILSILIAILIANFQWVDYDKWFIWNWKFAM